MRTPRSVLVLVLLNLAALVGLGLIIAAGFNDGTPSASRQAQKTGGSAAGDAWSSPTSAAQHGSYPFGVRNLVGASPKQVGQYALEYMRVAGDAQGPSQVLLARPVTREDVPGLGLGCMGEAGTIEEPPLVLVILKGDFALPYCIPSGGQSAPRRPRVAYAGFIFDLWAAEPTFVAGSVSGALFQKALNDPNLAIGTPGMPTFCPTSPPYTKTVHYGGYAPGFTPLPTRPPEPTPTFAPVPSPHPTHISP